MDHTNDTVARLDELMAEIGWVRRLARALVRDPAVADDVAQDAWLLATQHPPSDARPLRPWLRRVVLNAVRMRHRAASRREAREAAIVPGDVPTPSDLVERIELQRAIADEVLALTEPYRSTVLLHFVEGLPSAEIARRLGVPDGTVRRRLKMAIDQLRERLRARGDGPKSGWLAALIPFAQRFDSSSTAPTTLGGITLKKGMVVVVLLIGLLFIGAVVWWRYSARRGEPGGTAIAEREAAHPAGGHDARPTASVPLWIAQVDVPGRRVAGQVRSLDGPVGGAIVRLALSSMPGVLEQIAELHSGPDGRFDFGVQPAATFSVSAEAPKLTPSSMVIAVADPGTKPDQIVLQLGACQSRLFGSVLDASGGGIAKARLLNAELGGGESEESGHYSLCLPDANSRIQVEADGYGTIAVPLRMFGAFRYDFVLVPEAILMGQVITERGTPVAGARVIATPHNVDRLHQVAPRWTTTDRDGRFRIVGLAPGIFQLRAFADGLATRVPRLVIARPATLPVELRLVLEPVAQVRGRVVMAGRPVSGARVAWNGTFSGATSFPGGTSFSQADGSFVLSGVPFGTAVLTAWPYEVSDPKSLAVTRAVVDDFALEVHALATLRGRVTRSGRSVAGAAVTSFRPVFRTTTDPSGAFVLEGLPPGDNRIHAVSLDLRAVGEDKLVTLAAGENQTLDIELEHGGRATGIVVDQDGGPVPNVYVHLVPMRGERGGESMTDEHGAFDCGGIPEGDYVAGVQPSAGPVRAFAPATGERLAVIHVPRDGVVTGIKLPIRHQRLAIRGKVVDDLGSELSDVHVQAFAGRDYGNMAPAGVMSDATGRFQIAGLTSGTYSVQAHAADGGEAELLGISAGADAVTIMVPRPGIIDGTLLGFSATPIVEIITETPDLTTGRYAFVDGSQFSAPSLPPGRYTVLAQAAAEVDGQAVDVRPGETTRVTLRSRGLGRIDGRIVEYGSSAPVTGMRCDSHLSIHGEMPSTSPPDQALQALTDATGHFSLVAPSGRIRVYCFPLIGRPLSITGTDVDVTRSGTVTVDLVVARDAGARHSNSGFMLWRTRLPITVSWIEPGGPAASSGLAIGDRVVAIDGASVQGMLPATATVVLGNYRPGTTVAVGIERGGMLQTIKIVMGDT